MLRVSSSVMRVTYTVSNMLTAHVPLLGPACFQFTWDTADSRYDSFVRV